MHIANNQQDLGFVQQGNKQGAGKKKKKKKEKGKKKRRRPS